MQCACVYSLPNYKILDQSKLKASADDKINVTENSLFILRRLQNIVGKRENAHYQHFLLFPQCFHKTSLLGLLKAGFSFLSCLQPLKVVCADTVLKKNYQPA